MIEFDLWKETFIFSSIFALIILIPCILVVIIGRKMINRLGQYPSKTPKIQLSIMFQLVLIETFTFVFLLGFYHVFS